MEYLRCSRSPDEKCEYQNVCKKPSKRHVMCWIMEPYWILSAQCIKFIKWIKTSCNAASYSYYSDYYCYCRCSLRKHMWTQGRCCFGFLFYLLIVSFSRLASICKIDRNTQIKYRIDVLCVQTQRHKYEIAPMRANLNARGRTVKFIRIVSACTCITAMPISH